MLEAGGRRVDCEQLVGWSNFVPHVIVVLRHFVHIRFSDFRVTYDRRD